MAWKKKHFFRFYLIKILPKGRATPQMANEVWTYKKKKDFQVYFFFLCPLSPSLPLSLQSDYLSVSSENFRQISIQVFELCALEMVGMEKMTSKQLFPPLKNKSCQSCYKWPQALIYLAESCNRRFATILQNFLQNPLEWQ